MLNNKDTAQWLKGTPKLFFIITYFDTMNISKNGFMHKNVPF